MSMFTLGISCLTMTQSVSQFSCSIVSDSLRPHELQRARPPCPSPTPRVHPNSCPLSRWCHLNISSSVIRFSSCLQSFPTSGSFQMNQLFTSGGQNIGISASAVYFTLTHGPDIAGSYAELFFTASDFTFTTIHIHKWMSFLLWPSTSFFLELLVIFLHYSPLAYWTPTNLGVSSSGVISFCLFTLFMGFSQQEYWCGLPFPPLMDHVFQNSPLWPIHLGWSCTTWLVASLSYTSPFIMRRLWFMKGNLYFI